MRFHGLQVLRFVAAFSVVLYHSGLYAHEVLKYQSPLTEFLHHPAFGSAVFLFFTLSGFVIAHTLATVPPGRFFLLRAIRLYPAYWLAAALVLLTRYCLWAEVPPRGWASFGYGLLLLPGGSVDSFALSIEWSLVYEVVFYLVFGLLALGGKRWILSGAAVWLVACLVKLFASHGFHAPPWPKWGGIALSAFNLYFLAGVVTYHLRDYGQRFRWFVPLILPVLLITPYIGYDQVVIHLSRSLSAALIVWYAANSQRWQAGDALVRYGDLTYGLYLVHAPVIVIADTLARFSFRAEASDTLVLFVAGFSLAVGSGFGWIELCFYRWLRGRISRKVIIEAAAGQEQRRAA